MQVQNSQGRPVLTSGDLDSLHILIADDEPMICETLAMYLQHIGIREIRTVPDGGCALQELGRNPYDYLFVDLMMPRVSGLEVIRKVNESQELSGVIVMTGYPSMETVIEVMHHGASDFLVKPFRFEDVKITLERLHAIRRLKEKNWLLHQELEKKKEVEELNYQLEKKIRLQTTLYNIVDSLSKINRSDSLYYCIVKKAAESCNARRACFMIYDQGNTHLLALAQEGLEGILPGVEAPYRLHSGGARLLEETFLTTHFGAPCGTTLAIDRVCRAGGIIGIPFNIRNEPFGVLLLGGKSDERSFDGEDEFILKFLAEKAALNIENIALYDNVRQSFMATLMALVSAIEAKDPYTQQHSSRVTEYAGAIALRMGGNREDLQRITSAAPLHDIGKIGVSDSVLNKPGRLTDEEFKHIQIHPLTGVNIVAPLGLDPEEIAVIRNHHERWDGRGYPDGLRGEDIPKLARILAVADSFDAMNSDRAYRKALPPDLCIRELKNGRGTQFDPAVVDSALEVLRHESGRIPELRGI
jgi:putative nucleotidyltransferase with HDIG domain